MKKISFLIITLSIFFTGCINKHGISLKYYSDCDEYYDYQGYYHKECNDNLITHEELHNVIKKKKPEPKKGNVW